MRTSVVLLLSGLAAQQVSATWNRNAGYFNSPEYNNNECSDKQKGGFHWEDLKEGPFDGYGDFGFGGGEGGWKCANSFGKRDALTKRTFNSKCIKNKVKKDKPATFNCDKKKEGFSVKEIDVSVEYDTELELHYKMPGGNTCKQKASCKKEGSTIYNTQCGGAESVDVYLGNNENKDKEDCEIGFHRIDFDCKPPTEYKPPPPPTYETPTPPPESASKPVETPTPPPESTPESTPVESTPAETPTPPPEVPSQPPIYGNSSVPVPPPGETPPPAGETTPVYPPGETPPPAGETTPVPPPGETPPPAGETTPVYPPGETPPPAGESTPVYPPGETPPPAGESTPVYPPGETPPPAGESTPVYPPGETPPPAGETTPSTTSSPQPSQPADYPPPPPGGYSPPECLPKCMNTWLQINSECKSNTDADCYCKNPDFTKSVIECVTAWAKDDKETQEALNYLVGICAPAVPENPGIITNCPSDVPIGPTPPPAAEVPATSAAPSGPAPTEPAASVPVPSAPGAPVPSAPGAPVPSAPGAAPPAPSYPVTTITYESSTYTVPQVHFTTETPGAPGANPEQPVALVPGTPPPVPAQTTGAPAAPPYPIPTSLATATYPGVPGSTGFAPTAPPAQFTGAASAFGVEAKHAFLGAALAFFAL